MKNRAALSSNWAMWSWLSCRKPLQLFNVFHAWHTRPQKSTMDRIREAFEALKAPHYRTARKKCGPNPWQQDHRKARDAKRGATKKDKYTSMWDRWQNDEVFIEHLNKHTIAQMSGSSTSTLSRTSTSAMMHLIGRGHDVTIQGCFSG